MNKVFGRYKVFIERRVANKIIKQQNDLSNRKDRLFIQFLTYCFPFGIIALIPGLYMSYISHFYTTGIIDAICFVSIIIFTLGRNFSLWQRKVAFITIFYILAVFLIANLGFIGPGVFYLLAITVFVALFFSTQYAVFSVVFNFIVILTFGVIIHFKLFHSVLYTQYNVGEWIAFSSNLIFLSMIFVVLIKQIFDGLQSIIDKKELHKSKYQNIFENSPLAMWVFDVESLKFLDVNKAAIDSYGYSKAEFLTMTILEIRPKYDRSTVEETVNQNKRKESFISDKFIHYKKNGDEIIVRIESSLINYHGNTAKLVLATDITDKVKNERQVEIASKQVKQSESNLKAVFESAIQGFVLLDLDDKIILFNTKAKESIIFNLYKPDFIAGESIFNFIKPLNVPAFKKLLTKTKNGQIIEYDKKHIKKCGVQWIHYSLTPVYEGGQIAGICITGNDITEFKKYVETIEHQK